MGKKIMTVDDSASIRMMVKFTLKDAGYDVFEAENGVEALEKLNGSQVQMVIVDVNMPKMDGIELVRRLRSDPNYRYIPIIILTTESQELKKQEGRDAGATGWIIKPFKPQQLLDVVRKVLG